MSGIEEAIKILKKTFDKYSGKDGDKDSLSKKEVARLLKAELPGYGDDKKVLKEFFEKMDLDGDGTVCFPEFLNFVGEYFILFWLFQDV